MSLLLVLLPVLASSSPFHEHIRVPRVERSVDAGCTGDVDAPFDIVIDAIAPGRRPGGFVEIFGTVTPRKDIDDLRLRFESEGGASIFNRTPYSVGRAPAHVAIQFSLLARFGGGESAIHVWAEPQEQTGGEFHWNKRGTLYAVVHRDKLYTGMGDHQRLMRVAIDDDIAAGLTTTEQAREQIRAMLRMPFRRDDRPLVPREFNANEQRLNKIVGANPRESRERGVGANDHHPGDRILVEGNVQWTDENGNVHPAFGVTVDIRDDDTIVDENITSVVTDLAGNYEAIVDNDDGFLQGDRDIYVRIRTANNLIDTKSDGLFGASYEAGSPVHDETPNGATIVENFTTTNTGTGPAMSVFQAGTWIAAYARDLNGGSISSLDIVWPSGEDGSYFNGDDVRLEQPDRWDWDTIHHEYGHFVMDELNIDDNPGGAHNIGDCAADVRGDKSEGNRLAWGEGWPTFFGTSGQLTFDLASLGIPRVGDTGYDDLEDTSVSYDLEAQTSGGQGEDNELAVQRLLFDLFDNASDDRDAISRGDQSIWNAIDGADPETLSGGWAALRSGQSNADQILMGEIASDHAIGPTLNSPAEGTIVSPSNANFSWDRNVGCSTTFDGDSFDLVFFNAATNAPILTIPGLTSTSESLSEAQLATLVASSHQVLWGVEGRNTNSPATGPYLGETFSITVNRPPAADAGADQTVECTSEGTTAVALNGTASSDPDGDALTYSWSAPGVVFDSPSSATPTGSFAIGTHVVTLTVSDGIEQDSDTVSITVQDTTPPVINCPAGIIVECTGNLGVQADDPQLVPFFTGVSATDVCDTTPVITNDAPAFFPLGDTIVTFTATDDHGNVSSCSATVTVLDTQAPTITASVTPNVLWPPNHKMVTINATVVVTDECDPNPTFVLTSITSNEPDNGLGDGDATNDIQGAELGTPDTQFQVRAERGGVGAGRQYLITYTGSDSSGNTAQTQVRVVVPHNKN